MSDLELWAGPECSVVRIGERYVDQLELTGHDRREDDVDRLAALGIRAIRQPLLWERTLRGAKLDWSFADERLSRLQALGIRPIVGLVHHGSGPPHTNLLEDSFVTGLAEFARAVAERYPWVRDFTPVNEPLTTARFSALYGHWYPHRRNDEDFVRALIVQCQAIRAAMTAIREVIPTARLVQTEDLGTVFSKPCLDYQAEFENIRRFLSLDILTGRVTEEHPLQSWLIERGIPLETLQSFIAHPSVPDLIGLNHYVASDRFLDDDLHKYPPHTHGGNQTQRYADVEAVRVLGAGIPGHRALLELLWNRYQLPLAITEAHLGCTPEEQIRWLLEAWRGALAARAASADVRAVTIWAAFGAYDWDSLLTRNQGHYERGLFDVRHGRVHPTALANVARDLATCGNSEHPMLDEPGWWQRRERIAYTSVGQVVCARISHRRPVLITGAGGALGRACERLCAARGFHVIALPRSRLDIANAQQVQSALDSYRPWAVVNAAGNIAIDEAEKDDGACFRSNVEGPSILAEECAKRGIRLATFSSDLVFDGSKHAAYVESDPVAPLNAYGRCKAQSERAVRDRNSDALIVRSAAFFGPLDEENFVTKALRELRRGKEFQAASDTVVSPTYVPDLADAILTLLVDGASDIFHVATPGAISWYDLAKRAAEIACIRTENLIPYRSTVRRCAPRPCYSALTSSRAVLLRPLEEALILHVTDLEKARLERTGS
jgi:dTDP-4-dehydrorhamnose reductase